MQPVSRSSSRQPSTTPNTEDQSPTARVVATALAILGALIALGVAVVVGLTIAAIVITSIAYLIMIVA